MLSLRKPVGFEIQSKAHGPVEFSGLTLRRWAIAEALVGAKVHKDSHLTVCCLARACLRRLEGQDYSDEEPAAAAATLAGVELHLEDDELADFARRALSDSFHVELRPRDDAVEVLHKRWMTQLRQAKALMPKSPAGMDALLGLRRSADEQFAALSDRVGKMSGGRHVERALLGEAGVLGAEVVDPSSVPSALDHVSSFKATLELHEIEARQRRQTLNAVETTAAAAERSASAAEVAADATSQSAKALDEVRELTVQVLQLLATLRAVNEGQLEAVCQQVEAVRQQAVSSDRASRRAERLALLGITLAVVVGIVQVGATVWQVRADQSAEGRSSVAETETLRVLEEIRDQAQLDRSPAAGLDPAGAGDADAGISQPAVDAP